MKTQALLINEMKIILLYEMNHEIEGLFHDVHLGGLLINPIKRMQVDFQSVVN
jgi:hypothetical protein